MTASLPFIEMDLNLTSQQMSMLINGLKYILSCQTRFSRQSIDDITKEQYQNISTIVKNCLKDHGMLTTDIRAKQAFPDLEDIINGFKSRQISKKLDKRSQYEYKIIQSIRCLLRQRPDICICRIDKTKALYIGNRTSMIQKAYEYMTKTVAYQEISDSRSPLADIFHGVHALLDSIVRTRGLTDKQRKKLAPNLTGLELAHYHGLPKTHKDGIPLRPIIASIHAPTTLLSKFLNNLLAPIYLQVARETTFINDIDLVRKLEIYVKRGRFTSSTIFITADVKDLYTMIPREGALAALIRFLEKHSHHGKIGTLTIDHILRMARLILDTNYFVYNNKYYKQVRGGAMGSAFTQVLANIYMFECVQDLIEHQNKYNGIYGRYIDDIFMTTNQSIDEFNIALGKAKKKDLNIEITPTIGTSVNFLDVIITNEQGHLKTSIYHKPTADPYILPYTSDNPRHIHRNIPYASLLRAARLCSHVDDFNTERIRIDMSLLLNHYPPNFITARFRKFFTINDATAVLHSLDEHVYHQLHQKLLQQPTRREKQLTMMMNDPVKSPAVLQTKPWNNKIMYLQYKFDSALTIDFPKLFYQWWKKHFKYPGLPLNDVRIRMIGKTNRTLEQYLIHKKPPKEMLTTMEPSRI